MAKQVGTTKHNSVHKLTKQGGHKKTSSMNKSERRSHKTIYRDWETDRKSTRLNSSHRL